MQPSVTIFANEEEGHVFLCHDEQAKGQDTCVVNNMEVCGNLLCCRFRPLDELRQFCKAEVLSVLRGFLSCAGITGDILVLHDVWPLLLLSLPHGIQSFSGDAIGRRSISHFAKRLGILLGRRCVLVEDVFIFFSHGDTLEAALSGWRNQERDEGSGMKDRELEIAKIICVGDQCEKKQLQDLRHEIKEELGNSSIRIAGEKGDRHKKSREQGEWAESTMSRRRHGDDNYYKLSKSKSEQLLLLAQLLEEDNRLSSTWRREPHQSKRFFGLCSEISTARLLLSFGLAIFFNFKSSNLDTLLPSSFSM